MVIGSDCIHVHVVINLTIIPSRTWRPLFHIYDDILTSYMYVVINLTIIPSRPWRPLFHIYDDLLTSYMYVVINLIIIPSRPWRPLFHIYDDILTTYIYCKQKPYRTWKFIFVNKLFFYYKLLLSELYFNMHKSVIEVCRYRNSLLRFKQRFIKYLSTGTIVIQSASILFVNIIIDSLLVLHIVMHAYYVLLYCNKL
jgi:hypothetical protein